MKYSLDDEGKYIIDLEQQKRAIYENKGKSLADIVPHLIKEWHPRKNGDLLPTMVSTKSSLRVWWLYPYDDEVTGKHFDFEWQTKVSDRSKGTGCPFLSRNPRVWVGFNDLATTHPELCKEWHPTKNGELTPQMISRGYDKNIWWLYPYDDEITGKHFEFEWQASADNRTKNQGCPYLCGKMIYQGFNDLATTNPELCKEWHPTKNGELTPQTITGGYNKKVWWLYPYDDEVTGKHFDFEWEATVASRNTGTGCPFLSPNPRVWEGFNDLATTNPELAKEWHPIKNGTLMPNMVSKGYDKKVWWLLSYDDEVTGKHFDFEWESTISNRIKGNGCPYLVGQAVMQGFNDLETVNPELAKEWHPTKNGNLTPQMVTASYAKKVWWLYPYDDDSTGKHFDFEWEATVASRNTGTGCPFLSLNPKVWVGFNDLETVNPELAKEWHPTKNGKLTPKMVTKGYNKKVWWYLPYYDVRTGNHYEYEWKSSVNDRTSGNGCPFISASKTEQLIYKILLDANIEFEPEFGFDKLRKRKKLLFDIYIKTKNCIIELDGQQHSEPVEHFGGLEKHLIQVKNDIQKNSFCLENQIPILRIPYIYDPIVHKDVIVKLVMEFIQNKIVPREILDYYKEYPENNYVESAVELNEIVKRHNDFNKRGRDSK